MKPINLAIILALGSFSLNGLATGDKAQMETDVQSGTTYQDAPMYEEEVQAEEALTPEEEIQMEEALEEDLIEDGETYNEEQSDDEAGNE